jgi:mono/diheme cytochrome c family protein
MKRTLLLLAAIPLLCLGVVVGAQEKPSGADLIQRLGCMGCHSHKGKGGGRGPAFDGLGARLKPEAIKQQLIAPRGRMPNYKHLRPEELEALVTYLSALP